MVLFAKWGIVAKKGADKTRNGNNAAIQIAIGAYAHLGKSPLSSHGQQTTSSLRRVAYVFFVNSLVTNYNKNC